MKKSLFALAAVGAFAGAAQAQSSVTVYGLLDYGYLGSNQRYAAAAAGGVNPPQNTLNLLNTRTAGFGGNGQSTSRIGFRGTEDLGGGMSAFFTIEAGLNTDTAGGIITTSNTGNRQTFLGLSQKGIGAASIGIQYTPVHEAVAVTDAGEQNNVQGNVIYDRAGGYGSTTTMGTGAGAYTQSGMATNTSYTVRTGNALVLKTERMAGFAAKAMFVQANRENNSNACAGAANTCVNDNSGIGFGLDYQWQKLYITANYQSFKQQGYNSATFAPGYAGGNFTPGTNAADTQQYYAATYDFGILKAYVQYINRKVVNTTDSNNYVSRTAQQIGVRAPITKTITAFGSIGNGQINPNGTGAATADFTGWQVGGQYNLSKRTNLYAIYGATQTSNAKVGTYAAAVSTVNTNTSYNQSSYAVGVRHTF